MMHTAAANSEPSRTYRMKDLCELTELSRQTIHFYVQQGLLPPGHKTGRNMAYYTDAHLERLQLIQRLQRESFLPLKAIKAVLDGEIDQLDPSQRELLTNIKLHLPSDVVPERGKGLVDAQQLASQHGLTLDEVQRLGELGFLALIQDADDRPCVPESDVWSVEIFGQLRQAGFSAELGFTVDDLATYEDSVTRMFEHEKELFLQRMSHLPPEQLAETMKRALPLVHALVAQYHTALIRNLFTAME